MNKRIFSVIASAAVVASAAQAATTVTYPDAIWDYKFTISANTDESKPDQLTQDWVMYGAKQALNPSFSKYWADSFPWALISFGTGDDELLAASSSALADKSKLPVNDWLVTKNPVKVTTDQAVLTFNAFAGQFNGLSAGTLSFGVKVNTTGNGQSDFPSDFLYAANIATSNYRGYSVPVADMKDKNVYFSFINNSTDQGVFGLGNFKLMPYAINVENLTQEFAQPDTDVQAKLKVSIRTGKSCKGFKCVLKDENGKEYTSDYNGEIGEFAGEYTIVFDDMLNLGDAKKLAYTITITPNYEGAPATVVSSELINSILYKKKVVVEEGTGTWCGWCPRGAAYLDYNSAKFRGQFYGIAVHGSNGASTDPMEITGRAYLNGIGRLGVTGYPSGLFNREYVTSFTQPKEVANALKQQATEETRIELVEYDKSNGKVTVYYQSKLGYNSTKKVNMAVALIEDGCKGTSSNWGQQNNYARTSQATIATDYGEDWWPYFQRFCEGTAKISYSKMVYDHVARGIYPSFAGKFLTDEWESDQPVKGSIEFVMPDNVSNDENTAVVLLMLDATSNAILSADRVHADRYNDPTVLSVEGVAAAQSEVSREGDLLRVDAEAGAMVNVYGIDGTLLASKRMTASTTTIDGSAFAGIIIVKVDSKTVKMVW